MSEKRTVQIKLNPGGEWGEAYHGTSKTKGKPFIIHKIVGTGSVDGEYRDYLEVKCFGNNQPDELATVGFQGEAEESEYNGNYSYMINPSNNQAKNDPGERPAAAPQPAAATPAPNNTTPQSELESLMTHAYFFVDQLVGGLDKRPHLANLVPTYMIEAAKRRIKIEDDPGF